MAMVDSGLGGPGRDDDDSTEVALVLTVLRRLDIQDARIEELRAENARLHAELNPFRRLAAAIRVGCDHVADAAESISQPDVPPLA